ncbi:MAG: 4Fe-4S dicluster domain-containing protein [Acetobacter sp.]|nr:4Fe-4S dicluster domain-containing protein [Acetobacter sp.]
MNNKSIQKLRFLIAFLAAIIYIAGFLGFFYPIKLFDINIAPLIQRILTDFTLFTGFLLLFVFAITLIFGRIYCSTLCPLGLFQELCLILFHRKKLPQHKNRSLKYFITAITFGTLFSGTAAIIRLIDPYTIFGSTLSGVAFGIAVTIFIAILTGIQGRWFCTNLCPVGTLLGLISRKAYNKIYIQSDVCVACGLCAQKCPSGCIDFKNKTVNNELCIKCFKCLTLCHNHGLNYGHPTKKKTLFSPSRRRFLIGSAALLTLAAAYKTGIKISSNIAAKVKTILLPPGAVSAKHFANKCLNCNLCVENCPMKIIKKKDDSFPTVHIDFGKNYCSYNCNKCSNICPSGAISRLSLKEKRKTQIGIANFNPDICIQCGLCVRECPRSAISKQQGDFPIINTDICIGCGACQAVCPVSAIKVTPTETQKILLK